MRIRYNSVTSLHANPYGGPDNLHRPVGQGRGLVIEAK